MTISKCSCPRDWCEYFDSSKGEWGESYTLEQLKRLPKEIDEEIEQLKLKKLEVEKLLKAEAEARRDKILNLE